MQKKKVTDLIVEECTKHDDNKTKIFNKTVTKTDNKTKLVIKTVTKTDNQTKLVNKTVKNSLSCILY